MTANDLIHDIEPREPEPLTPEEYYVSFYQRVDDGAVRMVLAALRDMIASLDAEVARLTETVNRQERVVAWLAEIQAKATQP